MSSLPPSLKQIAFFFERLPGIGEKTANRLAFYLLRLPQNDLEAFSKSVSTLREKTKFCTECMNLTEDTLCHICQDVRRDHGVITVVEEVLDSGKGEADAGVVGNLDFVVNLNKGNVIVNAEEYSFILDVNARQRFEIHTGD